MRRIALALAVAATTPACMHFELAPAGRDFAQAGRAPARAPGKAYDLAPEPVLPSDHTERAIKAAAGVAIALGVFLYVD